VSLLLEKCPVTKKRKTIIVNILYADNMEIIYDHYKEASEVRMQEGASLGTET
jgi:hypothetical protein